MYSDNQTHEFLSYNAVKYIWRSDLKKDAIQDLKKAVFYIQEEIKLREEKHSAKVPE